MISPNCPALSFPVETNFRCLLNGRSGFTAARHAREHLCEALYDLKHLELFSNLGVALLEICILRLEQSNFFAHLLEKGDPVGSDMRGLPGVSKQPFVVPYSKKDLKRS